LEELAAIAEEMSSQTEQLQQTMSFFKLERGVRARGATLAQKSAAKLAHMKQNGIKAPNAMALAPETAIDEAHFAKY
jgi:methyl-accepting chemotaxis protein